MCELLRNLLFTICYDGSAFHGWQVQKNAVAVQQVFQDAVEKVFGSRLDVVGCSRTDSGVHANMYCCTVKTTSRITENGAIMAMNTKLPKQIAVLDCKEVELDFHPRYFCKSKQYVYKIYNGKIRNPFYENYAYHYRYSIDAEYLNREAQAFVGKHDFAGFCSVGSKIVDTVRQVKSISVNRDGDMVYITVEADGFLYNMVRIIVGTLLFVAQGLIEKNQLPSIIESKNRKLAGKTAPPQGLYLNRVNY